MASATAPGTVVTEYETHFTNVIDSLSTRPPENIKITDYYKYEFTIEFTVGDSPRERWSIVVGGDSNDIYRFYPFFGWSEWLGMIRSIKRLE